MGAPGAKLRGLAAAAPLVLLAACGGASPPVAVKAPVAASPQASAPVALVRSPRTLAVAGSVPGDGKELAGKVQVQGHSSRPSSRRAQVVTEPFRIAEVPLATIPAPVSQVLAPFVAPTGEDAPDLFVDWESTSRSTSMLGRPETYVSVRVSLRGYNLARLRIGNNEGSVTRGAGGGVYVVCRVPEDAPRRFVSARWESLAAPSAGSATLSIVDAWFDMHTCKAIVARRTSVQTRTLAGGILYAYREPCAKCAEGESVTFLGPTPQHASTAGVGGEPVTTLGAFSRVTLPVRRGGGSSLVARYSPGVLRDWFRALGRSEAPDTDVIAGIDVVQGVEDPEPIAIASTSSASPGSDAVGAIDLGMVDDIPVASRPVQASKPARPRIPFVSSPRSTKSSDLVDPFSDRGGGGQSPSKRTPRNVIDPLTIRH